MIPPGRPANEPERLQSLAEHNLLDTLPEEVYDDITRLAAEICGTPIAAINLIADDRQWSKSHYSDNDDMLPLHDYLSGPRDYSFCAHTILNPDETMVVPDTRYDERFLDNPLTVKEPHIIFYAGVPVKDGKGLPLGSLCVIDSRPRELSDAKLEALRTLAKLVNTHFQLRRTLLSLDKAREQVASAQPALLSMNSTIDTMLQQPGSEANNHLQSLQQQVNLLKNVLNPTVA